MVANVLQTSQQVTLNKILGKNYGEDIDKIYTSTNLVVQNSHAYLMDGVVDFTWYDFIPSHPMNLVKV